MNALRGWGVAFLGFVALNTKMGDPIFKIEPDEKRVEESEEAVDRLHAMFQDSYVAIAPPLPNFAGVSEPTPVLAYDNLLLTNGDVSDELVTKVLDGLANNKDALIAGFPLFRGLDPDQLYKEGLHTPFHPASAAWASTR